MEYCLCGCNQFPKGKRARFLPGHDALLKARLFRTIRDPDTPEDSRTECRERLVALGWKLPVTKAATGNNTHAAQATQEPQPQPQPEPSGVVFPEPAPAPAPQFL